MRVWDRQGGLTAEICTLQNPVLTASFSPANSILVTGALPYVYVYEPSATGWSLVEIGAILWIPEIRHNFAEPAGIGAERQDGDPAAR